MFNKMNNISFIFLFEEFMVVTTICITGARRSVQRTDIFHKLEHDEKHEDDWLVPILNRREGL
jgi:hypothetical protein